VGGRLIRLADLPVAHPGRALFTGRTPSLASRVDQRFSYRLFIPPDYRDEEPPLRLWVFVHGTERDTDVYLDAFADLATEHRAAVLVPLFPAGMDDPNDLDAYKMLEQDGVRYDLILLSMIDEAAQRWCIDAGPFFVHGYSGGGQFVLRLLLLHPERLSAVSIGAPGRITRPDPQVDWWEGIRDVESRFGRQFRPAAVARVPTQIVIGSSDNDPATVAPSPGGADRLARARTLKRDLDELGSEVRFDVVDEVAHDGRQVISVVKDFLRNHLLTNLL
jgi:poly(3-hydroxybutyrate) depolymerase